MVRARARICVTTHLCVFLSETPLTAKISPGSSSDADVTVVAYRGRWARGKGEVMMGIRGKRQKLG